jgi:hypothetical protein
VISKTTPQAERGNPQVLPHWLETAGENHDGRTEN